MRTILNNGEDNKEVSDDNIQTDNLKKAYVAHCENIDRCWIENVNVFGFEKSDGEDCVLWYNEDCDGEWGVILEPCEISDYEQVFKSRKKAERWVISLKEKRIESINKKINKLQAEKKKIMDDKAYMISSDDEQAITKIIEENIKQSTESK